MMNDSKLSRLAQIKSFLQESGAIEFNKRFQKEAYYWIEETLQIFHYFILTKKEKGLIRKYLKKVTGYSRAQLNSPALLDTKIRAIIKLIGGSD